MLGHDEAARLALNVLQLRKARANHLPADLFGEAAWDMLLVLFIADAASETLTVAELCRRAGGYIRVAQRWITVLQQRDLVAISASDEDHRVIALTPKGVHAVELCMEDAGASPNLGV